MQILIRFVLYILLILVYYSTGLNGSTNERKLLAKLFEDYNPLERPVKDDKDAVQISFGITLMSIQHVDEKAGTVEMRLWLALDWNDANLVWDPIAYNNITSLKLPVQRLWRPDIYAYNSEHESFDPTFETLAVLSHDGNISHIPPGMHKFGCSMDFTYFPFEDLRCDLKYGSWTHHGGEINITMQLEEGADVSSFTKSSDWELEAAPGSRTEIQYTCCPESYLDITYSIHLKRRGDSILLGSKIVNAFICFMIIMSFIAPPASGTKLNIGFLTMIFNVWIIVSINSILPSDHSSLLSIYFHFLCALVFSSVIANMFTIFLHYRMYPMPDLVKKIFVVKLPTFLHFICPKRSINTTLSTEMESHTSNHRHLETEDTQNLLSEVSNLKRRISILQDEKKLVMNDWNYLASIVDRCFLVIYLILILIFNIVLFPSFDKSVSEVSEGEI